MEAEVVAVRFSNIEPNSKRGRQRLNELKKYRSIDKFIMQYVSHMQLHLFYFVSHRKLFDLLIASSSALFVLFPITCYVISIIFSCSAHIDH